MRLVTQIATICAGGAALGFFLNVASGRPVVLTRPVYPPSDSGVAICASSPEAGHHLHGHKVMSLAEAVAACNSCSVAFVDARGAAAYQAGHIPGAVHLPPAGHPDEAETLEKLRAAGTVVVYDAGGRCGLAEGVADRLESLGFSDVRLLEGSWTAWQAADGPAESGACAACAHEGHSSAPECSCEDCARDLPGSSHCSCDECAQEARQHDHPAPSAAPEAAR